MRAVVVAVERYLSVAFLLHSRSSSPFPTGRGFADTIVFRAPLEKPLLVSSECPASNCSIQKLDLGGDEFLFGSGLLTVGGVGCAAHGFPPLPVYSFIPQREELRFSTATTGRSN